MASAFRATRIFQCLLVGLLLLAVPLQARAADGFAAFDHAIADTKAAMMGDPQHALIKAESALDRARALPAGQRGEIARATAEWLKGEALIIPNDHCLHGRDPIDSGACRRLLLRSYVVPAGVVAHHGRTMISLEQ